MNSGFNQEKGLLPNSPAGFTLLEVLLAIAILSVALLAMATLTGSIIGYNQLADQTTTATTLAQDKIEELKNTSYDSISPGTEPGIDASGNAGGIYDRETIASDDTPAPNMKTIEVKVKWDWKGDTHNVHLRTIVAR